MSWNSASLRQLIKVHQKPFRLVFLRKKSSGLQSKTIISTSWRKWRKRRFIPPPIQVTKHGSPQVIFGREKASNFAHLQIVQIFAIVETISLLAVSLSLVKPPVLNNDSILHYISTIHGSKKLHYRILNNLEKIYIIFLGPSNPDGSVNFECHCVGHLVASPCGYEFRQAISCAKVYRKSNQCNFLTQSLIMKPHCSARMIFNKLWSRDTQTHMKRVKKRFGEREKGKKKETVRCEERRERDRKI